MICWFEFLLDAVDLDVYDWSNYKIIYCTVPEKSITTPLKVSDIPRGRGVLSPKILEEKYDAKVEFPGGGGVQNKNLPWGEYGYFLEMHILL